MQFWTVSEKALHWIVILIAFAERMLRKQKGHDPLISGMWRDLRLENRAMNMSDLLWLTNAQMARLESFFPKSHGKRRGEDKHVLSGIIFINRKGLRRL